LRGCPASSSSFARVKRSTAHCLVARARVGPTILKSRHPPSSQPARGSAPFMTRQLANVTRSPYGTVVTRVSLAFREAASKGFPKREPVTRGRQDPRHPRSLTCKKGYTANQFRSRYFVLCRLISLSENTIHP